MKYNVQAVLGRDAERVSNGVAANQSQESLDEQLKDLQVLATRFGLYDAADYLLERMGYRTRYEHDFGEVLSHEDISFHDAAGNRF